MVAEKDKPECCGVKLWIWSVTLASFLMGTALYIYSRNFSQFGFVGTGFLAPAPLLICIGLKVGIAIKNKMRNGTYINP